MAQIAQQDHLYIEVESEEIEGRFNPTTKEKVRKHFIKGTLMDCIIKVSDMAGSQLLRIIGVDEADNEVTLYAYNHDTEIVAAYSCGTLQPSDYTDDTPSPDIQ